MRSARLLAITSLFAIIVTGCITPGRHDLGRQTLHNAALVGQFQAYDGHSGKRISLGEVARRCKLSDVVLFGEMHSDAICNQLEAQLFYVLAQDARPVALAMEFFEADTQATLEAYLRGRVTEPAFRELTRQNRAYVYAHRPLIEFCRAAHVLVIAANAPRRLVRAYRRSGLDYDEYRAGLDADDQRWVPRESEYLTGPYEDRFMALMGGHGEGMSAEPLADEPDEPPAHHHHHSPPALESDEEHPTSQPTSAPADVDDDETATTQPTSAPAAETQPAMPAFTLDDLTGFYRAQLLWDDAMAETLADYRAAHLRTRLMLIVGVFHVSDFGGTVTKFRARRPDDRVLTIVYRATQDGRFPFDPEDRHAGDIVIYGIVPEPEPEPDDAEAPAMPHPMPTTAPTSQPASQPTTQPTTQPCTAPATQPTEPDAPPEPDVPEAPAAHEDVPASQPAHPHGHWQK